MSTSDNLSISEWQLKQTIKILRVPDTLAEVQVYFLFLSQERNDTAKLLFTSKEETKNHKSAITLRF